MKTLVVYYSLSGTARTVAAALAQELDVAFVLTHGGAPVDRALREMETLAPERKSPSEAADSVGCAGVRMEALCRVGRGRGMQDVELYAKVRYAVRIED